MKTSLSCLIIAFSALLIFSADLSFAAPKKSTRNPAPAESIKYTVKKGDTLNKISRQFQVSLTSIKNANKLDADSIQPGMKLVIPKKDSDTKAQKSSSVKSASASSENSPAAKYHIVKKGDTLNRISKKYSVSVDDIKHLNNLKAAKLKTGQKLLIVPAPEKEAPVVSDDGKMLIYEKASSPVITSAKIQEAKEFLKSEEITDLSIRERLTLFAKKMLHIPYKFGGTGNAGLDCSSYVQNVYTTAAGLSLPRSAREQYKVGEPVDKNSLSVGDLVFFRTYASFPSHVGIYLGNNLFIHASSKSKKIVINSLDTPYYLKRYIGARKLLIEEIEPQENQTQTDSSAQPSQPTATQ
ncbi:MAG: LysM peptidoglycan-binding domain-containing protein [Nitrospiraceae bacterium]|nr:LysM peptidoglycan-binding domain-containing protein [Nitrospiraceae bacterium]